MRRLLLTALAVALLPILLAGQSGSDLFQKALSKERVDGQFAEAIALYERVVREFGSDRALAAKALVQIGRCYERLGNRDAQKAYERVVREFGDQRAAADEARARLAALEPARTAVPASGIVARQVPRAIDVSGTPSSDGRYLSGTDWATGDLVLQDLTTMAVRRLTHKGSWAASPSFAISSLISPDGSRVAYAWYDADLALWTLRVVNRDGARSRRVYGSEQVGFINPTDWSPDGRQIVATLYRQDGSTQIAIVSVESGSVLPLKTLDWRPPDRMRFSPDGRYVVYDFPPREGSQSRDIFLLAVDGTSEVPLVQHAADDTVLGWIPQSDRLLFASDRTGTIDAWMVAVSGVAGSPKRAGTPEAVKKDIGAIAPMGFTHGGAFYHAVYTGMQDVCVADFNAAEVQVTSPPTCMSQRRVGSNYEPFWAPDGRVLAYVSERDRLASNASTAFGTPVIAMNALDGTIARELAPKLTIIRRPRWSPDGRSILVRAYDGNRRSGVFTIDPESGTVNLIARGGHDAVWSRDGASIFYRQGENHNAETGVWVRTIAVGDEREIYHGPAANLSLSPDGRLLAFPAPHLGGGTAIKVIPAEGGSARDLYWDAKWQDPGDSKVFITWLPDSRHLLFNRDNAVWRLPADGGEPRRLGLSMNGLRAVQLSPDGKRLAFSAGERKAEVWIMENVLSVARPAGTGQR